MLDNTHLEGDIARLASQIQVLEQWVLDNIHLEGDIVPLVEHIQVLAQWLLDNIPLEKDIVPLEAHIPELDHLERHILVVDIDHLAGDIRGDNTREPDIEQVLQSIRFEWVDI